MAKLNSDWCNAFRWAFEEEEDVIEFIFENISTKGWQDSYIDVGGHGEPNEMCVQTVNDKKNLLYDFMMGLVRSE